MDLIAIDETLNLARNSRAPAMYIADEGYGAY